MARSGASKRFPIPWNRERFALRADSDLAQLALIRAGAGIGVYQVALARRDRQLMRVLPDLAASQRDTWITMHEDLRASPRSKTVFDALVACLLAHTGVAASLAMCVRVRGFEHACMTRAAVVAGRIAAAVGHDRSGEAAISCRPDPRSSTPHGCRRLGQATRDFHAVDWLSAISARWSKGMGARMGNARGGSTAGRGQQASHRPGLAVAWVRWGGTASGFLAVAEGPAAAGGFGLGGVFLHVFLRVVHFWGCYFPSGNSIARDR